MKLQTNKHIRPKINLAGCCWSGTNNRNSGGGGKNKASLTLARQMVYTMARNLVCQMKEELVTVYVGMRGDAVR